MGYTYDAENFKEIFEKNFTWLNGFMRNVRRFPDKTAMIDPLAWHTLSLQPVYLYYLGFTLYLLHGFLHFGFYVQVLSEVLFAYKQSKSSLKAA